MVDALRKVHAVLRPGAVLLDVRPATSRVPRLERGGRVIASLSATDHTRHHAADSAIATLVTEKRLRPLRSGAFWYRYTFADRASLKAWVEMRDDWTLETPVPRGRITMRRCIEFTHFRVAER